MRKSKEAERKKLENEAKGLVRTSPEKKPS
jgi:hypothetical protein